MDGLCKSEALMPGACTMLAEVDIVGMYPSLCGLILLLGTLVFALVEEFDTHLILVGFMSWSRQARRSLKHVR